MYDVIVVGAGHAGAEAALAASRMGCRTVLVTLRKDNLGMISCNPAIGGVGKGQLVKEIDALGGEMGRAADYAGIQFRMLNASKGAAVQSSRAQVDRALYVDYMSRILTTQEHLTVYEGAVEKLLTENGAVSGVELASGEVLPGKTVVITPGTFMNGLIHIGLTHFPGGRIDENAVAGLSQSLRDLGFTLLRFKTGTCARLNKATIDYSELEPQYGDADPIPFSYETKAITREQVPCYITYTNERTHEIIRSGMDRSPLYTGIIQGTGVRYCPSIEDKIMRFSDKDRHQIFLEPEGLTTNAIYPNGLSTSLPEDVQIAMFRSIKGLEHVEILKIGYGIEHDVVEPTQLFHTLETKRIRNLYCAGQINGTTGYEEAGAQGLIAGMNAALRVQEKEPLILDRSTSYAGVLIDDLVTKGTNEPYRMFTSRVEYRLLIREDNADERLGEIGYRCGLLPERRFVALTEKLARVESLLEEFRTKRLKPNDAVNTCLHEAGVAPLRAGITYEEFLRRPGSTLSLLQKITGASWDIHDACVRKAEIEIKYEGYIDRQLKSIERFKDIERIKIPQDLEYKAISGLSREIQDKLTAVRPVSLGQASRISGVTPAAIMLLMVHIKRMQGK